MDKNEPENKISQVEFQRMMEDRQNRLDSIMAKSHVLRKQTQTIQGEEQEILLRIRKAKELTNDQEILRNQSTFSVLYWKIYFRQNTQLFSWILLDFSCNFLLYPLDTIKTRIQANNRLQDICHFQKNNLEKKGQYSVLMSDFLRNLCVRIRDALSLEKQNFQDTRLITRQLGFSFASEGLISALFLPIEIRKINLQMVQRKFSPPAIFDNYMKLLLPAILRDSLFYFSSHILYNTLKYQDLYLSALFRKEEFVPPQIMKGSERNQNFACMMGSIVFSLMLTNPLDVVITKMAAQQEKVYTNPIQCMKYIKNQESLSKLLLSGISTRFAYYLIKGTIFFSYYDGLNDLARSALE